MKTTEGYNSLANQEIKRKFVNDNVVTNVNNVVDYILKKSYEDNSAPFSHEDVENLDYYHEYVGDYVQFEGGTYNDLQNEIERLKDLINDLDGEDEKIEKIEEEIKELENLDPEYKEVFEWWIVSSYLLDKLKEKGEAVIESKHIWGRGTTGQSVSLDYIISDICEEMEILIGQSNEWKVD